MEEMEQERGRGRNLTLPIAAAAVPVAFMLVRRFMGGGRASKEQVLLRSSNIDLQTAMNTALKFVPGTPVEVELEEEYGMPVWQVEIVPKKGGPVREVIIDARSGDLLELKAEMGEEELEERAA